ncbi:MAG: orotate phosphoribosyltransferase [Parcubacteria group bacterium Gr01-1014_2]|nr:MAG: orotate phosphoribosyltransferase [Parcubacteria group bacterium Gr01-1014_2]
MNETELEALKLFNSCGAIIKGHFVYASGRHGTIYVNTKTLFSDSKAISKLCRPIAERFKNSAVNSVTGPANNGVVVASWVAEHLSNLCLRKVTFVPTVKTLGNDFLIRRIFRNQIFNKRVLVVEDVLTTGGSARKVIDLVLALGGNVVGLGVFYNRGGEISRDGVDVLDFFALVNVPHQSWSESECPLCKNGIPINPDFGRGKEFLARKRSTLTV